jgi:hypothetical protein
MSISQNSYWDNKEKKWTYNGDLEKFKKEFKYEEPKNNLNNKISEIEIKTKKNCWISCNK